MKPKHPYNGLNSTKFWNKFVSDKKWKEVEFIDTPKFKIELSNQVVTAGSCFAQHISRHIVPIAGYKFFITRHEILSNIILIFKYYYVTFVIISETGPLLHRYVVD